MNSIKITKGKILYVGIIIILVLVGIFAIAFSQSNTSVKVIDIDFYCTSSDKDSLDTVLLLKDIKSQFGESVNISLNFVGEVTDNGEVLSVQRGRQSVTEDFEKLDIAENKRLNVIYKYYQDEFWDYVQFRFYQKMDEYWQLASRFANLDVNKLQTYLESDGQALLLEKSNKLKSVVESQSVQDKSFPFLYIDDVLYEEDVQFLNLASYISKIALRKDDFSLENKIDLDQNLSEKIKNIFSDQQFAFYGVFECYYNEHCNDKPGLDGYCFQESNVQYCKYQKPITIEMSVISKDPKYDIESDVVVGRFRTDNKGLVAKVVEDVQNTPFVEIVKDSEYETIYFFAKSIESSEYFNFYLQEGIIQIVENYYKFNNEYKTEVELENLSLDQLQQI